MIKANLYIQGGTLRTLLTSINNTYALKNPLNHRINSNANSPPEDTKQNNNLLNIVPIEKKYGHFENLK